MRGIAVLLLALVASARQASAQTGVEDKLCSVCKCTDKVLDCNRMGLLKLPVTAEAWPLNVEEALFDHNSLVVVTRLPTMPNLRRLSLRHNRIERVDDNAFSNLTALRELDLASNQLTRAMLNAEIFRGHFDPPEFLPLKNLTILRLESNSIHSLTSDLFEHVEHLQELSLAFNPMRVIDMPTLQALSSLSHLQSLDLSHIGIRSLPPHLLHTLLNLTALNLTANEFTEVPDELENAHQLRELRLSSNPIRTLHDKSFPASLSSLQVLEMNYMHNLTKVGPGALAPLTGLKVLHMSHSLALREIDRDAFVDFRDNRLNASFPRLRELVLRGNSLRTLDIDLLPRWDEIEIIDLEDNLWLCDCELQWVVSILEPRINKTSPELLRNFICEDPEPMRGNSIFSLHARNYHLRCLDADGSHPERDGLILVGVLVGVLLAVPATLAAVLCWRRGGFGWFGSGPAAYSRAFYHRAENNDF